MLLVFLTRSYVNDRGCKDQWQLIAWIVLGWRRIDILVHLFLPTLGGIGLLSKFYTPPVGNKANVIKCCETYYYQTNRNVTTDANHCKQRHHDERNADSEDDPAKGSWEIK